MVVSLLVAGAVVELGLGQPGVVVEHAIAFALALAVVALLAALAALVEQPVAGAVNVQVKELQAFLHFEEHFGGKNLADS